MEVDTQIWIARDLGFIEEPEWLQTELMEILAMLNGLIKDRTDRSSGSVSE